MQIDWDVPIAMDDGVVLRADVFRPIGEGKYPVILSYGPYAKGLSFQEGYKSQWTRLIKAAPDVLRRLEQQIPELGTGRSGEMGAGRLRRACASTRAAPAARPAISTLVAARGAGSLRMHRMGRHAALEQRQGRHQRHLLLRHEPVAGRRRCKPPHLAALCIWEGSSDYYRELCRHGGILCDFLDELVSAPGARACSTASASAAPSSEVTGELVAGPDTLTDGATEEEPRRRRRRSAAPAA